MEELWDLRDRYKVEDSVFRMTVRTNEDDYGNYTCAVGGADPGLGWELRGRPHAKLPPNTNVVEGQKLKLVCKVGPGPGVAPAPGPRSPSSVRRSWASRTPT